MGEVSGRKELMLHIIIIESYVLSYRKHFTYITHLIKKCLLVRPRAVATAQSEA